MDITQTLLLLLVAAVGLTKGAPLTGDLSTATSYLTHYGYLKPSSGMGSAALMSPESLVSALKDFQAFAGLNVTGELDNATVVMMETPRCGVQDMDPDRGDEHARVKRFDIHGSRWRIRNLTYYVSKYSSRLSHQEVDQEIARALQVWANHTGLVFTRWQPGRGKIHIDIRFERGDHGDWDVFDGPDGTLAHAYFPYYGGDVHFDDDEDWAVGNDEVGTSLFQIAVHELGHSLGLHHSEVAQAVMGPYYKDLREDFRLHQDDIEGITYLYGSMSDFGSTTSAPRTSVDVSGSKDLCENPTNYTMFTDRHGVVYVLKGELVYRLTLTGMEPGYPRLIADEWPGLPDHIDVAFTYHTGKTFFFKGTQYWRFMGRSLDGDYPKLISEGFVGVPDNLDAVFEWSGNGRIYFFKGTKFWKYDPQARPAVSRRYPKPISNWYGLPSHLNAALVRHGWSYFFKGGHYYRFNDEDFAVDEADPPFPRNVTTWWFGCEMIID